MLDIVPSPTMPLFAFGKYDEILISGKSYRLFESRDDGHYFVRVDGTDVVQKLTNTEISRWLQMGNLVCNPNALAPPGSRQAIELPHDFLSAMSPKQQKRAALREAMVMAFLEMHEEGKVKKTDDSIRENMRAIRTRAGEFLENKSDGPTPMDDVIPIPKIKGPRSLRRFVKAYEEFGLAGLYDHVERRGNRSSRLTVDELMLMNKVLNTYMDQRNLTQQNVIDNVWKAFDAANEERRAEGKPDLVHPSRSTIRTAIRALEPFRVALGRDGKDAARNKFAPVGTGIEVHRPLQRVEIDEWKADVITLMAEAGILHHMTEEEKRQLGLDRAKARWTVTVAICVRTRCIVGMVISRTPSTKSAERVIEMIMRDKGVWSDAVGALTPWNQHGWPSVIVTDCAKYNISHEVRARTQDAGVTVAHTPAAAPRMKPYIERVFRTMATNLMPRLTGRTFSNIIEKGDHDPEARAALDADDFCAAMVRWIVDIYHRLPHDGLGSESPAHCWDRLVAQVGVQAPPDLRRRRLIFGEQDERMVSKQGIEVLGVRYHSETLARWFLRAPDHKVRIRWYPEDIGAIAVELDGSWHEVPATFDGFAGLSAQKWLCAARSLRASHRRATDLDRDIVRKAIEDIEALNGAAMRRQGVLVEEVTMARVRQEEEKLFVGFPTFDENGDASDAVDAGEWGMEFSDSEPEDSQDPVDAKDAEEADPPDASATSPAPGLRDQSDPNPGERGTGAPSWTLEDK
jgi:putative transposase